MTIPWAQIFGIGILYTGIYWIKGRNVPVGIEGFTPSFYVKGKWAILLGVVAIIVGLFVAFELPEQIKIDKCLDAGGKYNYEKQTCEYENRTKIF